MAASIDEQTPTKNSKQLEMIKIHSPLLIIFSFLFLLTTIKCQPIPVGSCGEQGGGALCAPGFCCSNLGWCGNTPDFCDPQNCQSQCPPPPPPSPPPPPPSPPPPSPPPPPPSPPPPSPPPPSPPPPSPPPPSPPPPSPPPPPPPPDGRCGINHGGASCPFFMCCTVFGYCESTLNPFACSSETCQSQCGPQTCGVNAGNAPCWPNQCCTIAGVCALQVGESCKPPFCQSQCSFQKPDPLRISMLQAIA